MNPTRSSTVFKNAATSQLGRITQAGFIRNARRAVPPMRVLGQYALVYLLDGRGLYQDTNGLNRPLVPGDLILIFPKLPHAYGPGPGEHWTEFYLCFDGPIFDLWQARGLLDVSRPVYHVEPINRWLAHFESILGAPRKTGFAPPLLEICRLQQLLAEILLGGIHSTTYQEDIQWTSRACALLESDLGRQVDLRSMAETMGTGYESFRKRFTRHVGQPPARYRALRLIDRACELMQQGDLSDKEIAQQLGFCDEFHFSRRFKQAMRQSPREFRRHFTAGKKASRDR